ncbi:MAG: biotin/lipoyl-binding protein, partial [Wenzhouxiangellaceae bacterium]
MLTAEARPAGLRAARMSGTVQARFQTPVAFQVGGRIQARHVDAGGRVAAGQVLLELDPRDLAEQVNVARADLDAARAELATAEAETRRNAGLLEREFISAQVFERVELAEQSAR